MSCGFSAGTQEWETLICPSGAEALIDSQGMGGPGAAVQPLLSENGFADRHEKKAVLKGLNTYMLKDLYGIYERYSLLSCFVFAEVKKGCSASKCLLSRTFCITNYS